MPLKTLVFIFALISSLAFAGVEQISQQEFRDLTVELSKKVNLFQEVWQADPEAVFYGGTTRDFLYWVKGKFKDANTPVEAARIVKDLRALDEIDVRKFIIGDSDVDVVSQKHIFLDAARYGIRKFDALPPEIFQPNSELGKNEIHQGHIPAEKIRLSGKGLSQAPELGDGVNEIYAGKLSLHFSDPQVFWQTKYALNKENHPILLALRFLRLQAINYYNTHGKGYPNMAKLEAGFAGDSKKMVGEVIAAALDPERTELTPFLQQHRFRSWLNGTIQKAFRSYTNPTAALELMKMFNVDDLPTVYGHDNIEQIYQYVFSQHRNEEEIKKNLKTFSVHEEKFFAPVAAHFPDKHFYHGVKKESAFRSIVFQGILPSEFGSAAGGLYGVANSNLDFAVRWGGSPDRVVKLEVKDDAKIVDLTSGEGQRVWKQWQAQHGDTYDDFAKTFGIDILKYPYNTAAYVAKNSDALGNAHGVTRQAMGLTDILEAVPTIPNAKALVKFLELNQVTTRELQKIFQKVSFPETEIVAAFKTYAEKNPDIFLGYVKEIPLFQKNLAQFYDVLFSTRPKNPETRYRTLLNIYRVNQSFSLDDFAAGIYKHYKHFGFGVFLNDISRENFPDYLGAAKAVIKTKALFQLGEARQFHMDQLLTLIWTKLNATERAEALQEYYETYEVGTKNVHQMSQEFWATMVEYSPTKPAEEILLALDGLAMQPKSSYASDFFQDLLSKNYLPIRDLQYPGLLEYALTRSSSKTPLLPGLEKLLKAAAAVNYPESLRAVIRSKSEEGTMAVIAALAKPAWEDHPELIELLCMQKLSRANQQRLQALLELEHWKNHSYFTALKSADGKIDLQALATYGKEQEQMRAAKKKMAKKGAGDGPDFLGACANFLRQLF